MDKPCNCNNLRHTRLQQVPPPQEDSMKGWILQMWTLKTFDTDFFPHSLTWSKKLYLSGSGRVSRAATGICASRPLWCAAEDTLRWAALVAEPWGHWGLSRSTVEDGAEQNPRRTVETGFHLLTHALKSGNVISFRVWVLILKLLFNFGTEHWDSTSGPSESDGLQQATQMCQSKFQRRENKAAAI